MAFFDRSRSVDEVSPEENYEYVDYGDDSVPYGEEYDGNLPSNGLDEYDMYYSESTGNDDANYGCEEDHTNMETNFTQEIAINEESPTQDRTVALTKSFFGSGATSVKSKPATSFFFGKSQKAGAVPRAPTPPFSYISSDSSCGSTDSLVLSGESADDSLSAAASSGIALTTQTAAATEDSNSTPVRGTSPLQDSATVQLEAQRVNTVAKQLFSSPPPVKTSGSTSRPKPAAAAAPTKSVASASALATAARVSTAPSPFLSSAPAKLSASKFSASSFKGNFGSGFSNSANKKPFSTAVDATAVAGSTRPPLSSTPSQQQNTTKPKQKLKAKAKSVTFQTGTKTAKPAPATAEVTPDPSAVNPVKTLSVEQPASSIESSLEGQASPTGTVSVTNFVPVTPAPNSSMVAMSDRAVLHQVTPDISTSTTDQQRKQNGDDDVVYQSHIDYGYRDGIVSPVASRTVSTEEYHVSADCPAVRTVEPTPFSSSAAPAADSSLFVVHDHSSTLSLLNLDTAQALSLCEQQVDPQAEELRDRLRSARDTIRASRAAMVQHIHSAAHIHTKYLVEDPVGSAAPKLMELQRKMEQLRMRYKAIETARKQLCVLMEME